MDQKARILHLLHRLENSEISDLELHELQALLKIPDAEADKLRIAFEEKAEMHINRLRSSTRHAGKRSIVRYIWTGSAGASIVVLLFALLFLYNTKTFKSDQGEQLTVELPDGTQIQLNENSKLSYNRWQFGKSIRKVEFSGEAFFDVAEDSLSPFELDFSLGSIRVLGTSFYVSDPTEGSLPRVDLVEGKIALESNWGESVLMNGGQSAEWAGDSLQISGSNANYRYWHTGRLAFHSESLERALEQLEGIFQIQVEAPKESGVCVLDSEFENESPASILEVIAIAFGGRLEQTDNKAFILHGIKCD